MYGLTTQTAQVINGNSPYLTFDNGKHASSTILPLLSLTLPNNKVISAEEDKSSATKPIVIEKESATFSDIKTHLPYENYPSMPLENMIMTNNYWRDADGDKLLKVTGAMSVKWETHDGEDVTNYVKSNPNSELDSCKSPYKLTLSADNGSLVTDYGLPDIGEFSGASHSYYLYPVTPKVCYLQPNLLYGRGIAEGEYFGNSKYSGPLEQWDPDKGFKPQNINEASANFPTTGSNNLFFIVRLSQITADTFIKVNGKSVASASGRGIGLSLSRAGNYAVRITLQGPTKDSSNRRFSASTFKLYSDRAKRNLIYQFKISRWYIPSPNETKDLFYARSFCKSLRENYRVPQAYDLTNANGKDRLSGQELRLGLPGQANSYQRRLSYWSTSDARWIGGLFNEWGIVNTQYYPNTDWVSADYLVNNTTSNKKSRAFNVRSDYGDIDAEFRESHSGRSVCVAY